MAKFVELVGSLERLRLSERYMDLTIECKGKIFKAHCAIVCAQSKVIAAMIDGIWLEATTRKIKLEEDDPDSVAKMIDFLYKAQYDVDCGVGGESTEDLGAPLIVHAKLYILGDKYDIPSLKEFASCNYSKIVATQWNTEAFLESAEIIYDNIVIEKDALKNIIYEKARSKIKTLIDVPRFEGLLRRINDLAADMLISFIQEEKQKIGPRIVCTVCSKRHSLCGCSNRYGIVADAHPTPLYIYGSSSYVSVRYNYQRA